MNQFFDDSWEHMHQLLDTYLPQKKKRKRRFAFWLLTGIGTILLTAVIWFMQVSTPYPPPPAKDKSELIKNEKKSGSQLLPSDTGIQYKSDHRAWQQPSRTIKSLKPNSPDNQLPHTHRRLFGTRQGIAISTYPKITTTGTSLLPQHPAQKPAITKARTAEKIENPTLAGSDSRGTANIPDSISAPKPKPLTEPPASIKSNIKIKKQGRYVNLYAGHSISSLGYFATSTGIYLGWRLSRRWAIETGVGYKHLVARKVLIDTISGKIKFPGWQIKQSHNPQLNNIGQSFLSGQFRLNLLEIPLHLRYRMSANWSCRAEVISAYVLGNSTYLTQAGHRFDASISNPDYQTTPKPFFLGAGASLVHDLHRFRISVGYNYWPHFGPDHQITLSLIYRP